MEVQRGINRLGLAFSVLTIASCLALHAGTFLTIVPPVWLLFPGVFFLGIVVCEMPTRRTPSASHRTDWATILGIALLAYAVLTFIYVYRVTGGATSVSLVEGHYFSKYKEQIIRAISASEFQLFPSLWTRAMSAWLGTIAVFSARRFATRLSSRIESGPSLA
jgi:hypothetical protein